MKTVGLVIPVIPKNYGTVKIPAPAKNTEVTEKPKRAKKGGG